MGAGRGGEEGGAVVIFSETEIEEFRKEGLSHEVRTLYVCYA